MLKRTCVEVYRQHNDRGIHMLNGNRLILFWIYVCLICMRHTYKFMWTVFFFHDSFTIFISGVHNVRFQRKLTILYARNCLYTQIILYVYKIWYLHSTHYGIYRFVKNEIVVENVLRPAAHIHERTNTDTNHPDGWMGYCCFSRVFFLSGNSMP